MREIISIALQKGLNYIEAYGNSSEDKPSNGIATGSKFTEVDTGNVYLFDELTQEWYPQTES